MARNVDADKLNKDILASWDKNYHVTLEARQVHRQEHHHLMSIIEKQPSADVVPKSEVEKLEAEVVRITTILNSYALQYGTVVDKQKVIDKAKAKVAREIFEEIEKLFFKNGVFIHIHSYNELKKKYAEDKG